MPHYAIIRNNEVQNIIVAENLDIARNFSGDNDVIEVIGNYPVLNATLVDGIWIAPPYLSETEKKEIS